MTSKRFSTYVQDPPAQITYAHDPADNSYHVEIQIIRIKSDRKLSPEEVDDIKKSVDVIHKRGSLAQTPNFTVTQTQLEVVKGEVRPGRQGTATSTPPSTPITKPSKTRQRILFYDAKDPYYGFTNFSPDPVEYKGRRYPTSEHLFQALKFMEHRPELAEHIRTCSTRPRVVFDETHRFNPEVRPDWLKIRVQMMDLAIFHKFTQNTHLKKQLLSTGDAELVEDSPKDSFWGVGPDGKGENQLGKALERLRANLRGPHPFKGPVPIERARSR
ncbi:hypothetical protein SERLA73DRAFT_191872 [Serpula lacrymans var. lacrymans S7.3]|uniref:NADAR domain-containing protein n=2 Tax=Serpula lacrymans var. lacrymans TaxID=341189 RepID=F8QIH7_SERL3|nr:uncharacterized protein SERLADRAFT_477130 [Serpula lacrymans var. lacrymans S7.9]EGN91902.1 hypothetical protein SERLA73DRAFT_191872 [Serpula lacrymans var. lacrymans S7.3]EGO20701.1 hypothetical protein SERLADRAFT_477130 [Serpula lacrymans var. lacrymans S7.9]